MYQRPLVLMVSSYILGLIMGYYHMNLWLVHLMILGLLMGVMTVYKTYKRQWLVLLPFICFFAFVFMQIKIDALETEVIKDKEEVYLLGTVMDYSINKENMYVTLKIDRIKTSQREIRNSSRVQAIIKGIQDLKIGMKIEGKGTFYVLESPRNKGGWDEKLYYHIRGITGRVYLETITVSHYKELSVFQLFIDIREQLKERIYQLLPTKEAGIMTAMLLGDRANLDDEIKESFRTSGILHILAISGLHISLIGLTFFALLKKIGLSLKISAMSTLILLASYCLITGASVSTVRAVLMIGVLLGAYLVGRTYDIYSALALVAWMLLIYQPLFLLDVGFQLSFISVLGIAYFTPLIEKTLKWRHKVFKYLAVSVAAFMATAPLLAFHFYEVAIYGVFANLLVVPLLSLLVPMGILGICISFISIGFAKGVMGCVYYILVFYQWIGRLIESLPLSPWVIGHLPVLPCLGFYGLMIFWLSAKKYQWIKGIIGVIAITCYLVFRILPNGILMMTFLDVSQGDATYIKMPNGDNLLIDGGGSENEAIGEERIYPFLKYYGKRSIDYMVMTHGDKDHALGLLELLDLVEVNYLFVPKVEAPNELQETIIKKAKEKGVHVIPLEAGNQLNIGDVSITCLNPQKDIKVNSVNDTSIVLMIKYKVFDALMTGDIEKEAYILDKLYPVDIIKVPHHGSKTSSSEALVERTSPLIGIVSAGKNNLYGHPHHEVVDRYESYGTILYNTADSGAITIETNGDRVIVKTQLRKD